ncbi:LytTR family DNA-binding domain-containing protein [Winogradskyella aquimaris]|uniref:LytTR family DNA-binding domain-containing protein n=1 Tax=Winogradskyella aquimaris TaxID=864074 RepID=A0ABU5EMR9_9FLAO|nr:LytTR family DNA-binding domain-containing protein [Winogradskyella aquimaris]MDY2586820.1 LytTR family DNA-binding domain-containing protein [Winogradskyella aquimaris]
MLQNRAIAYTRSWLNTFFLSTILATIIVFILIFLQPFDTYTNDTPYKNLKLLGYSLCIIIPILILHVLEEYWFKKNNNKWFLFQEIIILTLGFFFIAILCYFYNTYIVNDLEVNSGYILQWVVEFGVPFIPIFMPLWIYFRFRFSKVVINPALIKNQAVVNIKGNNQNEVLSFPEQDFVMAKAQANYVDIYYLKENEIQKEMIRYTISGLLELIPSAQQIHRSYLVNPAMISDIKGNTRKGNVELKHIEDSVPISPKHFIGVQKYLQTRP